MSFNWELAKEAKADVLDQIEWFESDEEHGGAPTADFWNSRLETTLEKLAEAPHRFARAPENGEWQQDLEIRQLLFRPWKSGAGWRVLFAIDEEARMVSVLQIRHERRRWMFEDEPDED